MDSWAGSSTLSTVCTSPLVACWSVAVSRAQLASTVSGLVLWRVMRTLGPGGATAGSKESAGRCAVDRSPGARWPASTSSSRGPSASTVRLLFLRPSRPSSTL